jgi:hypothetical protein
MVFKCKAVCKYGKIGDDLNSYKLIELNAISKYAHFLLEDKDLKCEEITINFDDTPVGKTMTKYVTITNMLPVRN